MNFNIYSTLLLILSLEMFGLFVYSIFQRKNSLSSVFSFLCLSMTIYSFFYAFELMSDSLEKIKFFLKLEYFGVAVLPPLWFLMAYKFYLKKSCSIKLVILSFIIPFFTLLIASTNDFHHLLYKNITIINFHNLYVADLTKGIWYIISSTYSYFLIFVGQILFFKAWRENEGLKKTQSLIFLIGSLFPLVFSIVYLFGVTPGEIDPMPLSYMIFSILSFFSVFKYGFLEMKEIVREISFEQINEGIIVTDDIGRVIDFNITAQNIFSWLNKTNIGLNLKDLSSSVFTENKTLYEVLHENRNFEFRTTKIKENNKIIGKVYIFQDITDKKTMLTTLQHNAKYDFLSELYNRYEFFELGEIELYKAKRHKRPLAMLMIDIDFFKKVNDTFGHLAGDTVIKEISKIFKNNLRSSDIVGRYGGEEFLVLLSETDIDNSINIAEKIRKIIESTQIIYEDKIIKVTISIGISLYLNSEDIDLQELINNADKALYLAKNHGRNRVEVYK